MTTQALDRNYLTTAKLQLPLDYIMSGNATFTVVNANTGNRYTYQVRKSDTGNPHFVKVFNGTDNYNDFVYLGVIWDRKTYRTGKKSILKDAPSAKVFDWFWGKLWDATLPDCIEVWHLGTCGRCGRRLTVPESIASGFGPYCKGLVT